ncbi:acetyl-CoA carboxylase biotin carboxyl carrier protein subunit [Bordetella bronchiseptica]|uniref:Biotin protein n=3 Tax=Bordetella bronchiseptica TaxID=518 RepID=A0A0H3LNW2_BORBR|nr:acetyl-CoA carboxylase biotin carboxyl carrier protein subunit [Bordetella bronchiseptica]KAK65700.1 biotin-requiring enzyme [Bordetella bronchiseptica 980-2]KCV26171.1 biotin-requiring enzyme [Bordetella bronchiseptica 00-P-2730]KDD56694.1 biotin-requiring enzyme [Bordetella bronchiseptica OSU553]SHS38376.1 Biotinylated protein TB7.3 homolog [Mycobacteroides abscessus subsp. abscessus]AMG88914.1 acetyl-CoA carboxylase biotin carboxyl carrier protein subunit [Bordetella bronchiseptica]
MKKIPVKSEVTGNVWEVLKAGDDRVEEGETLIVVESMKMEIPVDAPAAGRLVEITVQKGDAIGEGDVVAMLEVQ